MVKMHIIRDDSVNNCLVLAEMEIQSLVSSFNPVFYSTRIRKLSCPFELECEEGYARKPYMAVDVARTDTAKVQKRITHLYFLEVPKHDEKSIDLSC